LSELARESVLAPSLMLFSGDVASQAERAPERATSMTEPEATDSTGVPESSGLEGLEHAVVARAIDGDPNALREVWHSSRRWVAAVLLANMPRDVELDDLLQEVAMTVVSKSSSVREPAAFKPWLRAVAVSIAKTSARRRSVRREGWLRLANWQRASSSSAPSRTSGPSGAAGEESSAEVEGRHLLELSRELPDGYREPLLLKTIQGLSYREIGRVMGLPETTIETRIARARRMLRERARAAHVGELS
jgi:RNA polymerase sigma-70 factor, ECF subfamily